MLPHALAGPAARVHSLRRAVVCASSSGHSSSCCAPASRRAGAQQQQPARLCRGGGGSVARRRCVRAAPSAAFSSPAASTAAAAEEPRERFVAEVVYALLSARSAGVAPAAVLPKFHDALTPAAYTSVLVALGRKELWDTAAQVAAWVRQRGMLLPAECYVRVASRRAEEGHWDEAVEALAWMKDLGCAPSGEAVEAVALLAAQGAPHFTRRERLREVVSWVRATDAGRALWRVYAPDAAVDGGGDAGAAPAWRSQGLVVEDGGGVLGAPLGELREALAELSGASGMQRRPASAPGVEQPTVRAGQPVGDATSAAAPAPAARRAPVPALSEIDALLLNSKRRT
jgi:hypothetical protein